MLGREILHLFRERYAAYTSKYIARKIEVILMLKYVARPTNVCFKGLTEGKWTECPLCHCCSKYESEPSVVCEQRARSASVDVTSHLSVHSRQASVCFIKESIPV
jgi:hypothetical protein